MTSFLSHENLSIVGLVKGVYVKGAEAGGGLRACMSSLCCGWRIRLGNDHDEQVYTSV
jgi:hypothetical protein